MDQKHPMPRAHDAAVFVVKNLRADATSEQVKEEVQSRLLKNRKGLVRQCELLVASGGGGECAFVVVDNGQAMSEAEQELEEEARMSLTTLLVETTTLTLSGPAVSLLQTQNILKLCYSINKDMDISIEEGNLTLKGYWKDINTARDKIYEEIQTILQANGHDLRMLKRSKSHDHVPPLPVTAPAIDGLPSHYDNIACLSPDVIELTLHKRKGPQQGVEYDSGQSSVHFTFGTQEELQHAMHTFEQEYQAMEQLGVQSALVPLPPRATTDDNFFPFISRFETSNENTIIRWDPDNQQLRILSTNLPQVQQQVEDMLRDLHITASSSPDTKDKPRAKELNWKAARKKNLEPGGPLQKEVLLEFKHGHRIILRNGDILSESVDAIVNPANKRLAHGGGLAKQIDRASNGWISHYSKQYVMEKGTVSTGGVALTKAGQGKLKCRYVIHAVGPNVHENPSEQSCKNLLKQTIQNVLRVARDEGFSSIAIPAISSGMFGVNKDVVAEVILDTLVDAKSKHSTGEVLKDIRVVIWDMETYYPFQRYALAQQDSLKECTGQY